MKKRNQVKQLQSQLQKKLWNKVMAYKVQMKHLKLSHKLQLKVLLLNHLRLLNHTQVLKLQKLIILKVLKRFLEIQKVWKFLKIWKMVNKRLNILKTWRNSLRRLKEKSMKWSTLKKRNKNKQKLKKNKHLPHLRATSHSLKKRTMMVLEFLKWMVLISQITIRLKKEILKA